MFMPSPYLLEMGGLALQVMSLGIVLSVGVIWILRNRSGLTI